MNYEYYRQVFLVQIKLHYTPASLMLLMNKNETSDRERWILSEKGKNTTLGKQISAKNNL